MADGDTETLTQDEAYDLLSNERRRSVITHLRERGEPIDVMELSRMVAASEYDMDPEELSKQQVKRVYVSLYQTHVPKLDERGVIEYDEENGTVRLSERVADLDPLMVDDHANEISWRLAYLFVALAGLLLYALVALVPLAVSPTAVGLLVIGVFAVLTGVHSFLDKKN